MRLIAFLFLAAFATAGVMRYSRAAAPAPVAALAAGEASRPIGAVDVAIPAPRLASQGLPQPAPQILRHKRRFAKAALRAIRQSADQEKAPQLKQMARVVKPRRR